MICLNHSFQITNDLSWIIWITRESWFWRIVVLRVITPVIGYISVLVVFLMTIKDWLELNIITAEFFDIVKGGCLVELVGRSCLGSTKEGPSKIFWNSRCWRFCKITNVHLTDNRFTWVFQTPRSVCPMLDFKSFYLSILLRENDGTFPVRACSNSVRISCQSLMVWKLNLILISFTCKIFV